VKWDKRRSNYQGIFGVPGKARWKWFRTSKNGKEGFYSQLFFLSPKCTYFPIIFLKNSPRLLVTYLPYRDSPPAPRFSSHFPRYFSSI
jgi:hypothetical protein